MMVGLSQLPAALRPRSPKDPKPRKRYPLAIEARSAGQLRDDVMAALDPAAPRSQPEIARRAGMSATRARDVLRTLAARGDAMRVRGGWVSCPGVSAE
jgi:DNA-binding GntR family transcriptional regulator